MTIYTELNDQITAIGSSIDTLKGLPDRVDQFCGNLALALRSNYASPSGIASVFSTEKTIDGIYGDRDKITGALRETWKRMDATRTHLSVPSDLLLIANEWRTTKGSVQAALQDYMNTDLSATWAGDAAAAYVNVRKRQEKAFESVRDACEDIAKSLERLADAELTLYTELGTKAGELNAEVAKLVGDGSASIVGAMLNPFEIDRSISALSGLVTSVLNLKTLIIGVISAVARCSAVKIAEGNMIGQTYSIIDGLIYNKWPAGVSEAHGAGITAIRDVLGDGTTADGDESGWNPGTTVVVAQ